MILTGEREELGEKPVPVQVCPPQTHMDWSSANPGIRDERPATNRLNHGSAILTLYLLNKE
jgi:hypothetical protein